MSDSNEMFTVCLLAVSRCLCNRGELILKHTTYLHLIGIGILSSTSVEDVMIGVKFGMTVRSKSPYRILKAHRRLHMRGGIEGLKVARGMDYRNQMLLALEENSVAVFISD